MCHESTFRLRARGRAWICSPCSVCHEGPATAEGHVCDARDRTAEEHDRDARGLRDLAEECVRGACDLTAAAERHDRDGAFDTRTDAAYDTRTANAGPASSFLDALPLGTPRPAPSG